MRKIRKFLSLILITTVFLSQTVIFCFSSPTLRVPLLTNGTTSPFQGQSVEEAEIKRILKEIKSRQLYNEDSVDEEGVYDSILRLELLYTMKVLKGNLLYFNLGIDILTLYFVKTFGTNIKRGLGVSDIDLQALEEKLIKNGLPETYRGKPKDYKIFPKNSFLCDSEFSEIKEIDVFYIKGLTGWTSIYKSFPGGKEYRGKLSGEQKKEFQEALEKNVQDLVEKVAKELLKEGGFIVIADKHDLWLEEIIKKWGYIDLLELPEYKEIKKVLFQDKGKSHLTFNGVGLVVGKSPLRVFQKPYNVPMIEQKVPQHPLVDL
ncbi:MAG: hypothetical protein ACYSSI_04995 [Planctomycetota bacterium]|jgi:hypothetical protein